MLETSRDLSSSRSARFTKVDENLDAIVSSWRRKGGEERERVE